MGTIALCSSSRHVYSLVHMIRLLRSTSTTLGNRIDLPIGTLCCMMARRMPMVTHTWATS